MADVQNPKTKIFQTNSAQDRYFTGNPEFSFFKKPYNQYHNFAMELNSIVKNLNYHLLYLEKGI